MTTKTLPKVIVDVPPKGLVSAICYAPFVQAKATLKKAGYDIISLEQNALLRMQESPDLGVSLNGNWTREGVIYVPNEGVSLTKNSPIMDNPKEATQAHRKGDEFYLTDEQIEKALKDSIKISGGPIPTNRFAEDPLTVYAFSDIAGQYGNFLREQGITEMPILPASEDYVNEQEKPFARQLWFGGLGYRSGLDGNHGSLFYGNGSRGYVKASQALDKKL